jgi:predicted nucleic acid-binding protein
VTLLVDTSGLLVLLDRAASAHEVCVAAATAEPRLVVSPFILAEADYLVTRRVGAAVALQLLRDVADGAYELASFAAVDMAAAVAVLERYDDLGVGLADASLVVLADRYDTGRVLTFDERHFRALRWRSRRHFRLAPVDP